MQVIIGICLVWGEEGWKAPREGDRDI